jgi:hypothetical protein
MPGFPPRRLLAILAAAALTGGCSRQFESDGTPEAEIVRKWLSQGWVESQRSDALIDPQARLVMSDFGVPLTRGNLRSMGPDRRLPECHRSTLRWSGTSVEASWTCPPGTDLAFRTVYFHVRNGRIASANYTEAYQAVRGE